MKRIFACLLACLLLTGCDVLPYPRELEDTMLVRVLGIDWNEWGVTLTAADAPTEGEEKTATLLTVTAPTFEESRLALKQAGEEYVALTHVTQLIVGADSNLRAVLEAALAEREVGQTATVWLAHGTTAQALMESAGGGAKRLTSLELNAGLEVRTVLGALAELEHGHAVVLPALTAEQTVLEPVGEAAWKEGKA